MTTQKLNALGLAVLRAVARNDLCSAARIGQEVGRSVLDVLDQMCRAGWLASRLQPLPSGRATVLFSVSTRGQAYLLEATAALTPVRTVLSEAIRAAGCYDGAELLPYEGRPGAMDAFAMPSRIGNTLHYRNGTAVPIAAARATT